MIMIVSSEVVTTGSGRNSGYGGELNALHGRLAHVSTRRRAADSIWALLVRIG